VKSTRRSTAKKMYWKEDALERRRRSNVMKRMWKNKKNT